MHGILSSVEHDFSYDIIFKQKSSNAFIQKDGFVIFHGERKNNVYKINFSYLRAHKVKHFFSLKKEKWLLHG